MSNDVQQRPAAWEGFVGGNWETNVDVRDFIQKNYTPYEGDASFLAPATEATTKLWAEVMEGIKVENRTHEPYKIDAQIVSGITSHAPGYINKDLETIVGLQTDEPLKRSIMPFGGLKMVQDACKVYNVELNPEVSEIFTKYRKTHNQGVFDVLYARHPPLPQIRRDYRPAGCLWPRPYYRRLPPRGIVRYRLLDERQTQPVQLTASRFGKRCGLGRSDPPPRRNQ